MTVKFISPTNINLPPCFCDLLCEDTDTPDAEYQVELISSPLRPEGLAVYNGKDFSVYSTNEGFLRLYTPLAFDNGCCVACLIRKNGKHILYYPASQWERFRSYWHCAHLLCGELLLLQQNAILLHSSVVAVNGKTILFCGASGAGKSTQANLWKEHKGADILNGDRCVIMKKGSVFFGGGSPWCGTSAIHRSEQFPIGAVFILKQHEENLIKPLGAEAFATLFSQTTVNLWDDDFVRTVSDFYAEILEHIPVYELRCRPDEECVRLAYETVFGKEQSI